MYHKHNAMPQFLVLLLPLAEIATFILVGKAIGIVPTLALVAASSVLGAVILRDAGLMTLFKLGQRRDDPATILREGGARMLAGLLLLIPGFLTDLAALALLAPGLRAPILNAKIFRQDKGSTTVVDGDFRQLDTDV